MAIEAFTEFSCKAKGNKSFAENMRFNQLCEIYFSEYAPNKLKRFTTEHYKSNVKNHIAPVFGNRKLKDISTSDVSAFLTGLDCKPLTASKIKIVFHSILKYAVNIFLHQCILQGGIPFELKIPNRETMEALDDVRNRRNLVGPFNSVEALMEDLNN